MSSGWQALIYDVCEPILALLDGRSLLAVQCVCKSWRRMCLTYLQRRADLNGFWRRECLRRADGRELLPYITGDEENDWCLVFKSLFVSHNISHRSAYYTCVELSDHNSLRLSRSHLSIILTGRYLLIIQGAWLRLYDVVSNRCLVSITSKYIVHSALLFPKTLPACGEEGEREGEGNGGGRIHLSADRIIFLGGGTDLSHYSIVRADQLLAGREPLWRSLNKHIDIRDHRLVSGEFGEPLRCHEASFRLRSDICARLCEMDGGQLALKLVPCQLKTDVPGRWRALPPSLPLSHRLSDSLTAHIDEDRVTLEGRNQPRGGQLCAAYLNSRALRSAQHKCWAARMLHLNGVAVPVVCLLETDASERLRVGVYAFDY